MAQAESVSNAIRALIPGANTNPALYPVRLTHAQFVTSVAKQPPRPLPLFADASDLRNRADHLRAVLDAVSAYVSVVLGDTARNVPGGLELQSVHALLRGLSSEVADSIERAADATAARAS